MSINLGELRENAERLKAGYGPIEDYCAEPGEVLALLEIAEAARVVANEREGHELPGESALYVKLVSLDEALARLEDAPRTAAVGEERTPDA